MGYAIVSKPPLPYPSAAALRRTPFGRFRVNNHAHAAKHGKGKKRLLGSARFNSGHRRTLLGHHPSSPGCLSMRSATHHVFAHPKYPYCLSLFFSRLCPHLPGLIDKNTAELPSILRPDKAPWENIQWPLLTPLLINVVAFFLFYFYLLSLRFRLGEITEEIKTRRMNRVD